MSHDTEGSFEFKDIPSNNNVIKVNPTSVLT